MDPPALRATIGMVRIIQWSVAVIIIAITAYLLDKFSQVGSYGPWETVVPLVFSALALSTTTGLYFLNLPGQFFATCLDFIVWVGYLASAGLLAQYYPTQGGNEELWQKVGAGQVPSPTAITNNALVKLLAVLVVIQM